MVSPEDKFNRLVSTQAICVQMEISKILTIKTDARQEMVISSALNIFCSSLVSSIRLSIVSSRTD